MNGVHFLNVPFRLRSMHTNISIDKSPAGRRRRRVRESIIAAAERVFVREGEAGLSIRRLAEEIDYSPAAIYKYFGSKEELVDELKEAFFERLLERVDGISTTDMPFEARAKACVTTYVETAAARPHHYAAAFSSVQPAGECGGRGAMSWEEFLNTHKGKAFSILIDMVTEGQQLGVFDSRLDPVLAAKSVWAASHGLALLLTHLPQFQGMFPEDQPAGGKDFVAFHADIIFRGLQRAVDTDPPSQTSGASS